MKIEAEGDEKIAVTLTENDMRELDITYEEMDYSNIETRRVIWTLLDEAKRVLGIPISIDNRLLVQVSPYEDGGCIIRFSQAEPKDELFRKRLIMKKDSDPIIFYPLDGDALIDSYSIIKRLDDSVKKTEFFHIDGNYCWVLYPGRASAGKITMELCEFGDIYSASGRDLTRLYEWGEKLSTPD